MWHRGHFSVMLLFLAVSVSEASEPQVAFTVKEGWLSFVVTQDEQPIPNAEIRVFDQQGNKFAEGDTSAQGRGEFPLPPGALFRMEFIIGTRTSDMITLTTEDNRQAVIPNRILLSFGLAPCCRVPAKSSTELAEWENAQAASHGYLEALPLWFKAGGAVLFTVAGLTLLFVNRRRFASSQIAKDTA